MKKILLIFLAFLFITATAFGMDVVPQYSTSIQHFGIGLIQLPTLVKIYDGRDENSEIIQKIYWDTQENYKTYDGTPAKFTFVAYVPKNNRAFLSVEDEDEDWYYVCYNQKDELYGWIKKADNIRFYTWLNFFDTLGRRNGIYVFKDIPNEDKVLYAKPEEDSQIIDTWQHPKSIKPWHINGNWVMVKLIDFDKKQKIGYIKWRNEDGSLNVFVQLK